MTTLSSELRNDLARAIMAARRTGESGAEAALETLAVQGHEPYGTMSVEGRDLRNRLRARGRQLGDVRETLRGTQTADRLAREVAYEHWHRMLFARFLAENGLLIEPKSGVAITMEACEGLAQEAGEDPLMLASRYAESSLPQLCRT